MSEQLSIADVSAPPRLDEFELFYQKYPRKVSKATARRAWLTARRRASFDEIMNGLATYPFSPDPVYVPYPATWLNGDRFRDVAPDLTRDSYGIGEWLAGLPRDGALSPLFYEIEEIRPILIATGWEPSWRGSLDVLNAWLRDGYEPDSVAKIIAEAVTEFGVRGALASFDKRVRYRARRLALNQ